MTPLVAAGALVGLVALATVIGLLLKRRGSRYQVLSQQADRAVDPATFGLSAFGARGSLVQFSTEYCARCPGVTRTIEQELDSHPSVTFVHVDLTHNLELARRFNVLQTPSLLLLDEKGRPQSRLSGAISREDITRALHCLSGANS